MSLPEPAPRGGGGAPLNEVMIECDASRSALDIFTAVDDVSFRVNRGSIFGFSDPTAPANRP
jgi:hypothetical protein